ncbi:MAG: CinA family protein [Spirochaetales bacterium]|nr:CinA family protein [Spirochaetales bacterium]
MNPSNTNRKPCKFSESLFKKLKETGKTLAFAESITAGNLCAEMVQYAGASEILLGGIVAYSNSVKMQMLGVKNETLKTHGAVSEQTVREMVTGLHERIPADFCAAVSGIAGPGGGSAEKPVGTVWLGLWTEGVLRTEMKVFEGNRDEIIQSCVDWVYTRLLQGSFQNQKDPLSLKENQHYP